MDRCRTGSADLAWEQTGAGEPVLLIHGNPATRFRPLMVEADLASYRLIRYHRRDWGGSSCTEKAVTIGDHAADALGLLTALEVRRAHVVGHSYGALVAIQLALDAGEVVGSLALLEPNLLMGSTAAAFNDQVRPAFAAYRAGDKEEAVAHFFTVVAGRSWEQCEATIEERIPGGVAQAVADADAFFGVDTPALRGWGLAASPATLPGSAVRSYPSLAPTRTSSFGTGTSSSIAGSPSSKRFVLPTPDICYRSRTPPEWREHWRGSSPDIRWGTSA